MRVLHSYCLNFNYGDYALGFGVKNMLREVFNVSYFGETNLQGQVFDEYYINEVINKKYDLLVIGGGGIIHGAHWPQGWFWLIEKENLKKIKIPFIIYGAGYNYFKDEEGIPERGISHLMETQKLSAYFSVRNDGSRQRLLEQTGIDANVIADPGFWMGLNYKNSNKFYADDYILVQVANDKPLHRFGSDENRKKFVEQMRKSLTKLAVSYKIVFMPHVYDDIALSKEIMEELPNSDIIDFSKYAFDHTYEILGIYKNAKFVLAMRGHGQIVPLGFNVPVISLENHYKHRGLMEHYGLGKYNANVLDNNFVNNLNALIDDLITNYDCIVAHCKKQNNILLNDSKMQLQSIDDLEKFVK